MKSCTADELRRKMQSGRCVIVDVRETPEYEAEHIPGARSLPLSRLDAASVRPLVEKGGELILVCRSGARASTAAGKLASWGLPEAEVLAGGLKAWTAAGCETVRGAARVWDLERQVRFAAGLLVLAGVALGFASDARFFYLSGFVGAGLVFAAVTNTCGMAMLLARMPWNRGDRKRW